MVLRWNNGQRPAGNVLDHGPWPEALGGPATADQAAVVAAAAGGGEHQGGPAVPAAATGTDQQGANDARSA